MSLKVLAYVPKLDPATKRYCGWDELAKLDGKPVPREARYEYFQQGFVDIDIPRDGSYTADIVAATEGYAVADSSGNVIGRMDTFEQATAAKNGAKMRLVVDVDLPEEEPVAVAGKASK